MPATADSSRWTQRVEAALAEVSEQVRAHVDITEGPKGLHVELLEASPRLAGPVADLTRDHLLIRGRIDDLLTRVAGPDAAAPVDDVRTAATVLLGRLVRHRQRGADLVFEAYQFDIGGET